jgi:hypothetical protein
MARARPRLPSPPVVGREARRATACRSICCHPTRGLQIDPGRVFPPPDAWRRGSRRPGARVFRASGGSLSGQYGARLGGRSARRFSPCRRRRPTRAAIASGPRASSNTRWKRFRPGSTLPTSMEAAAIDAAPDSRRGGPRPARLRFLLRTPARSEQQAVQCKIQSILSLCLRPCA